MSSTPGDDRAVEQPTEFSMVRLDAVLGDDLRLSREVLPLISDSGPLQTSAILPAGGLRICWLACHGALAPTCLPNEFVLAVTHGTILLQSPNGSHELLRAGSLLRGSRTIAASIRVQAGDGQPCRFAIFELDKSSKSVLSSTPDETGTTIAYLHNREGKDGGSYFEHRHLALRWRNGNCLHSDSIALTGIQAVRASESLDYDWHPAPQRQIVLVLTGGLAMEYGDGTRASVLPGEFLVGEDLLGRGHKTRALLGAERLSLFAHLADAAAPDGRAER